MDADKISPGDLASEVNGLLTGFGILTVALFPLALPVLIVCLAVVLPLVVLALPVLAIWLIARGVARVVRTAAPAPREPQPEPAPVLRSWAC